MGNEPQTAAVERSGSKEPADHPRNAFKVASLIIACTVIFYWKIILVRQYSLLLGGEGANQAYAWFNFWVSTIRHGTWPIWDPFTFSGRPFAGEMQTGAFYPPYLFFLAAPFHNGVFPPEAYHVFFVLTHALCAWFMYLLARECGLSAFAGIIAGISFSLGGDLARFGAWPHLLESGIWLPLMFMLLMKALDSARIESAIAWSSLCGLSLAMAVLAGGLHLIIMDAIVLVSVVVYHAARSRARDAQSRWRYAAILAISLGFAFAGGAAQLLPSAEYSRLAFRYLGPVALPATEKIPYNYMKDGLWPHSFLGLFIPSLRGSAAAGEYIDPYLGVLPMLLAIIGIWKRWRDRWVPYLTGLAAAAFIYSLGSMSLLHGFLYSVTPYLWMAREADRFMYLADFALALLAAFGLDELFSSARASWEPLTRAFKWVAVACLIALAYSFILGSGDLSPWISLSLLLILLTYGIYRYIVRGGYSVGWARFLILSLVLFDLSAFDWTAANRIEQDAAGHDDFARLLSFRAAASFLLSRPGPFRVELPINPAPNIGDMYGIEETLGAGVTMEADYEHIRGHRDLLNVRYIVQPASATNPGALYQDSAWKIYENPKAYPRAWLVHASLVEPDEAKLLARLDAPDVDLHRTALLRAPLSSNIHASSAAGDDQAQYETSGPNQMQVRVHANGRALLVLSDLFYPGWIAAVNGRPAEILKVDGGLRGIVVTDGDSLVSLRYLPVSFATGLALSMAAFLGGGLLSSRLLRSPRRLFGV